MVSSILAFAGGFAAGAVAGAAGVILYMRYRAMKQLERMEEQMGDMFDLQSEE